MGVMGMLKLVDRFVAMELQYALAVVFFVVKILKTCFSSTYFSIFQYSFVTECKREMFTVFLKNSIIFSFLLYIVFCWHKCVC